MVTQVKLGDMTVDVVLKDIKNIHLSVYPPTGRVRISAPLHMKPDTIRVFAISKLGWIRQHQRKLQGQERETPREFLDRESHYVWGKRYLMQIEEVDAPSLIDLKHSKVLLRVRPGTPAPKRQEIIDAWYREQVRLAVPRIIAKWEPIVGVKVNKFVVRRMKTKWGSYSRITHAVLLNTDLAKKPRECLEYIIVHEMVHFLEPTHSGRFVSLMDQFMPKWKHYREALNRLPVRHESWGY